jgi:hypothetical protein
MVKTVTLLTLEGTAQAVKQAQSTEVCRGVAEPRSSGYFGGVKTAVLKAEQFITDAAGKRVGVLLDLRAYERLREAEEDLADIRACDSAQPTVRAEIASGQFVTFAEYRARQTRKQK